MKLFLKELQPAHDDPPQISSELTSEQLINRFKIWMERTSTSPEGRHLGKSEIHPDHFFDIILLTMQISIKHSEPLERWGTVHNLFLLKEQGNYKIHRLRFLVHKIDAELNLIRREIVARRLMKTQNVTNISWTNNTEVETEEPRVTSYC
eukprot:scaffold3707_cov83-Attheya_sp.AAC.1